MDYACKATGDHWFKCIGVSAMAKGQWPLFKQAILHDARDKIKSPLSSRAGSAGPPFAFFEYSSQGPREKKAAFSPQWKKLNESTLPYTFTSDFPNFPVTTPDHCSLSHEAKFPPGSFIINPPDLTDYYLPADGSWYGLQGMRVSDPAVPSMLLT